MYDGFLSKKFSNHKYFTNFVLINHGLDPDLDPDWIRIQQQVGSGSGFNADKSETVLVMIKTATPWEHLAKKSYHLIHPEGKKAIT
jgi:hypothetical protein